MMNVLQGYRVIYVCPQAFERLSLLEESLIHQMAHYIELHAPRVAVPDAVEVSAFIGTEEEVKPAPKSFGALQQKGSEGGGQKKSTYLHFMYSGESTCLFQPDEKDKASKTFYNRIVRSQLAGRIQQNSSDRWTQ